MALISHPFRLLPNGTIATTEDNTDAYMAERIALMLTIESGERTLVPEFGAGDLAYEGLMQPNLEVQVALFGLPVDIISVEENIQKDESLDYIVEYELTEAEEDGDE